MEWEYDVVCVLMLFCSRTEKKFRFIYNKYFIHPVWNRNPNLVTKISHLISKVLLILTFPCMLGFPKVCFLEEINWDDLVYRDDGNLSQGCAREVDCQKTWSPTRRVQQDYRTLVTCLESLCPGLILFNLFSNKIINQYLFKNKTYSLRCQNEHLLI